MKRFALLLRFVILMLFASTQLALGQSFPVQITPQAVPPAPIYFSDYANESTLNSPLRVQIALNALGITNREVRLRVSFEGNGIAFQSNDLVTGATPLFVEGGIPLVLTNVELAPYFKFENITGISPAVYGKAIPEGTYSFCFEVFDAITGSRISGRSCASTIIFQNEPPILITPENKAIVEDRNPQNIVFQWVPRHINVSNVEYELSIVEIRDNQVDPQAVFLSSPPIFRTRTTSTTYVYGPADPLLLRDNNYAWRVQAVAKMGTEEIGTFKNQGYSEIYYFGHSEECDLPLSITAEVKGATNANILWQDSSTSSSQITVRYRKKRTDAWFEKKSTADFITIWDLEAGTEYEYQIAKACAIADSEFSLVQTFRTNLFDDDDSTYNCGIAPDIDVTNQVPLESLTNGDKFTAGDFPVTVMEVSSGGNGRFTGKGYVTIPYLKSIKVAVEFTNIFINQNKELAQGNVITIFDPNFGGIIDPWGFFDDIDGIINGGENVVLPKVDFDINSVTISDDKTKIIITGVDSGNNPITVEYEYDENDTFIVTGNNTAYSIDENGNVTEIGPTDPDGPATAENTTGLQSGGNGTADSPSVVEIDDSIVQIKYLENSTKYGWDNQNSSYEAETYHKVSLQSGGDFYPIHKAVKNGDFDSFKIEVTITDTTVKIEDLIFKTVSGIKIESEAVSGNSNQLKVNLKGAAGYRNEEAIITYKDEEEKHIVVGSFFIHHLRPVGKVDVEVITVNGAPMPNGLAGIAQKFIAAGADINLIAGTNFQGNTSSLTYTDSGLLRKLPKEFRTFATEFKNNSGNYANNKYYVFVFDNSVNPGSIAGFMPRGTQYGFVFPKNINSNSKESKKTVEDVIMHEIGHGVFGISHPFNDNNDPEDDGLKTDWAMDKGNGNQLAKRDWEAMGDKGLQLYLFDGDEDGEATNSNLMIWQVLNHIESSNLGESSPLKWKDLVYDKCYHERHFYKQDCSLKRRYSLITDSGVELKFKLTKQPSSRIENFELEPNSVELLIKEKKRLFGAGSPYDIYYLLQLKDATGNLFEFEFNHHDEIETFARYFGIGGTNLSAESFRVEQEEITEEEVREDYGIPDNQSTEDFFKELKEANPLNTITVIGRRQTNISIQILRWLDQNLLPSNIDDTTDCNDIDVYFAEIPTFHAKELTREQLWASLTSLLACNVDESYANEEVAVLTIVKALGESDPSNLLEGLLEYEVKNNTLLRRLFKKIDGEEFNELVYLLIEYWNVSKFYNPEEYHALPYESDKFLGFYYSNYSLYFDQEYKNVKVYEKEVEISNYDYAPVTTLKDIGKYHSYSTILLLDFKNIDAAFNIPQAIIPMFALKILSTKNGLNNWKQAGVLTFDVVTTLSGVGNLAKLRHLSHVSKLGKLRITLGATEVIAGSTGLMLQYSECSTDSCKKLRTFLLVLELASLSGDLALSKALKRSADDALQALEEAPNSIPAAAKAEIIRDLGKFADGANDFSKYPIINRLPSSIKNHLTGWPDNLKQKLESALSKYPNLSDELISDTKLLNHFFKMNTTWYYKLGLARAYKVVKSNSGSIDLPENFVKVLGDLDLPDGSKMSEILTSSQFGSKLGNILEDALEPILETAWAAGSQGIKAADLPLALKNHYLSIYEAGYTVMSKQIRVKVPNQFNVPREPRPDFLFFKKKGNNLDLDDVLYDDSKISILSDLSDAQKAMKRHIEGAGSGKAVFQVESGTVGGFTLEQDGLITIKKISKIGTNVDADGNIDLVRKLVIENPN